MFGWTCSGYLTCSTGAIDFDVVTGAVGFDVVTGAVDVDVVAGAGATDWPEVGMGGFVTASVTTVVGGSAVADRAGAHAPAAPSTDTVTTVVRPCAAAAPPIASPALASSRATITAETATRRPLLIKSGLTTKSPNVL